MNSYQLLVIIGLCGLWLVNLAAQSRQTFLLRFTSQPTNIIEAEGRNATFSCKASSTSSPVRYAWRVNGSTVLNTSNKYHTEEHNSLGSLTVVNLQRHIDNGDYRCIATNELGSILSNKAVLRVAYFSVLDTNQNINHNVKRYESITLQAPNVRSIPSARFIWVLDGHGVIKDGHSSNVFISPNGDLSIVAPTRGYSFTCIVQNPVTNQTFNKTYTVNITGVFNKKRFISFMKRPTDKVIEAGLPVVVFECIFAYGVREGVGGKIVPSTPDIEWYKGSQQIKTENSSKYGYLDGNTAIKMKLLIFSPDATDEGSYKCKANALTNISGKANLIVKDPVPSLSSQLTPLTISSLGKRVEIDCPDLNDDREKTETEEDDVSCVWYKNAVPLSSMSDKRIKVVDGQLIISSTIISDTGLYQVLIRNNGGEIIGHPTYLSVKERISSSLLPSLKTPTLSIPTSTSVRLVPHQTTRLVLTPATLTPRLTSTALPHTTPFKTSLFTTSFSTVISISSAILEPTTLSTSISLTMSKLTIITPTTTTHNEIITTTVTSATQAIPKPTVTLPTTTIHNETITGITEPGTMWTTEGDAWDTTERSTTKTTQDFSRPKKSVDDKNTELLIWISAAVGGIVILSLITMLAIYCCNKNKPSRKQSFQLKAESCNELEMNSIQRAGRGSENYLLDKKGLLTDDNEVMYAPVIALDNIAANLENKISTQGHLYDEPINNTKRKPYRQPLPTTIPHDNRYKTRPPSSHSYLELLGPDQNPNEVYAEPIEGEIKEFAANAVKQDEYIYDCAREGVMTDTLRRLTKQQGGNPVTNPPIYHVLEGPQTDQEYCGLKRESSSLYANPEDILSGELQSSSKMRQSYVDPLYHVLEPGELGIHNSEEENIKRESIYQPLFNSFTDRMSSNNIYQPLEKSRGPSPPSSTLHKTDDKTQEQVDDFKETDSGSFTDPKCCSAGNYDNNEDLYQPLNDPDRCPLDVSKPKASSRRKGRPKRDSLLLFGEVPSQPSRSSSLKVSHEPALHAVDFSPSRSLKESCSGRNTTSTRSGHRRNSSDTHTIVSISKLSQRRASVSGLGFTSPKVESKYRHKRNHSDAGLCPVNLSQLRVSICLDPALSQNRCDDSNSLYMALVKERR